MEEKWEVVEINKEKIVLSSPSGQRVELAETKDHRISARVSGIMPMPEVKFSDELWSKLDKLSEQNPEPYDKDDNL